MHSLTNWPKASLRAAATKQAWIASAWSKEDKGNIKKFILLFIIRPSAFKKCSVIDPLDDYDATLSDAS